MSDVATPPDSQASGMLAPITEQDATRVFLFVLSKRPKAVIPIASIARHLGIPLADANKLVEKGRDDGLLKKWDDRCLLSEAVAQRDGLRLASVPYGGKADSAAWYWVRPAGIKYEDSPWLIPLRLLPGSHRNRIWWLQEQRRLHDTGWPCEHFDELDPYGDRLLDPQPSHEPLEDDRLAERLSEIARWARDQPEGRLPPRIEDRRRMLPKADRAEYCQAMQLRIEIGTSAPGWTPAHEMIRIETDSAQNPIHIAQVGACMVCAGRDLGPQEACLGCCRSRV